jgi:hypothetical protein
MLLLPGLADATLPLNSPRCTIQMASYNPRYFKEPYGFRSSSLFESYPRFDENNPLHLGLFIRFQPNTWFMWRRYSCTFQGYVILFLPLLFRRIVLLALWSGRPRLDSFP